MFKILSVGRILKQQLDRASLVSSESVVTRQRFQALHVWMLTRRLAESGVRGILAAKALEREYINGRQALVYTFTDFMDPEIMGELARSDRCLFYSLDDHFLYGFNNKSLS